MGSKEEKSDEKVKAPAAEAVEVVRNPETDVLEDDDNFEDFPDDEFGDSGEEDDVGLNVWEDNWEDDVVEEDFSKRLA
ncbi:DSS1 SEM1 domain containing protein [Trichuris trichiura]|uniref:26S proteasome complex subunit dss-1 n=1 Tax=Trichuris trichiura TaxID=36087 RepID=A0A077Z681_TRITR|nr:DSS1 SEM1 domain containing protein [Trichuris trichiura]